MLSRLLTLGHGTADQGQLVDLLNDAEVERLVDVRRFPGSRKHPHVTREAMAAWLPEHDITYRWEERLGGRRRSEADSPDSWWRVEAFRGYAAHMRSDVFREAIDDLLGSAEDTRTVIMCSETLWWRCHRRMVADFAAVVRGVEVSHLMHDGSTTVHPVAEGARLVGGQLIYDGATIG